MDDERYHPPEKCLSCLYHGWDTQSCDYLLVTGERRGCPGGEDCARYLPRRNRKKQNADLFLRGPAQHRQFYLVAEIEERYEQGKSDRQIAEELKVSITTVSRYRRKFGMVAHRTLQKGCEV